MIDKFFGHRLHFVNPLLVVAAFIALVLNVFGHVTRPWCNATLGLLTVLLKAAFSVGKDAPSEREQLLLNGFPRDIRTVRKIFDLEAKTIVYAACPRCSCTYKPDVRSGVLVYP
ncbi:hypothetical protein BJ138DRAFT_1019358, partial [Hygrophoropsis aurantiaca]